MMSGGGGWWLAGGLFMLFCMAMMFWMMGGMMGHGHSGQNTDGRSSDPERTLADRLAKGEIDIDEFERLRDALRGSNPRSSGRGR